MDLLRSTIGPIAWNTLLCLSRGSIIYLLQRINNGFLQIEIPAENKILRFGVKKDGVVKTTLIVKSECFWVRVFIYNDMGFAEAYMAGEVDCSDLVTFFRIFIQNRGALSTPTSYISPTTLMSPLTTFFKRTNNIHNSLTNIQAHYDISNDMFAAFLSPDMTYSCPIWATSEPPQQIKLSPDFIMNNQPSTPPPEPELLQSAQHRKLLRFVHNARIRPTDHVLEIGTGWGSFAITAVQQTGCRVTTLTLSKEQKLLAEKRIKEAGFSGRITVLLRDYRLMNLDPEERKFDKIVSIEMLEAVGKEYLETYFGCVDELLKEDGGIAVFQCITMPEERHAAYSKSEDFIQKYIFPGGYLPSNSQLITSITRGSSNRLIVESLENIGGHYTRTLRLWKESFLTNFENQIKPALLRQHPEMQTDDIEVFKRKWEYYFTYCEAGFREKVLNDVIITVAREGCMELYEGVPL